MDANVCPVKLYTFNPELTTRTTLETHPFRTNQHGKSVFPNNLVIFKFGTNFSPYTYFVTEDGDHEQRSTRTANVDNLVSRDSCFSLFVWIHKS